MSTQEFVQGFHLEPRSLRRIEQGAECEVDAQVSEQADRNRALAIKMLWRPTKFNRPLPSEFKTSQPSHLNSTEVTVTFGIRIQPKDAQFKLQFYDKIKEFLKLEGASTPIGSLDPTFRTHDLCIEFEALMEGGIDWPVNYMKRFLKHFAQPGSLEKTLDSLCPPIILTIGEWERCVFPETKIADSRPTYPDELFALLGIPSGSDRRQIDLARANLYARFPPQKHPDFAIYIDDTINKKNLLAKLCNLKEWYSILVASARNQQNMSQQLRSEIMQKYATKIRDVEAQINNIRLPDVKRRPNL